MFAADGTGYFEHPNGNDMFNWRLDGRTLTLSLDGESGAVRLTMPDNNTLIIDTYHKAGTVEESMTATYNRIN